MNKDVQIFMNSRRMRHIKRCNNFPCLMPEDVAQHSYFVALLSKVFAEEYNDYCSILEKDMYKADIGGVLSKAICHDWDEAFTSDIPYVVKHMNPEVHQSLGKGLKERIDSVMKGCSRSILNLYNYCMMCKDGTAGAIVGICDMLELAIYCYEECTMNNIALEPILKNCIYYLDNMSDALATVMGWENTDVTLFLSEVSPTVNSLYDMVRNYNFSSDCMCIDIESHTQV